MKIDFEKVLADNNLKVGDKVRFTLTNEVYEIVLPDYPKNYFLYLADKNSKVQQSLSITQLIEWEWEKVILKEVITEKKKLGDLNCHNVECESCPLYCTNCTSNGTLYQIMKATFEWHPQLEPMREYIEKELNKEVDDTKKVYVYEKEVEE